jgi:hypothetical protein
MFPWRSHALWFLRQMARWDLIADFDHEAVAARVYRADLYRASVASLGVSVPQSDSKSEGSHPAAWELEASPKAIAMGPDSFCDGVIFEAAPAPVSF